jgi:xylulokinase
MKAGLEQARLQNPQAVSAIAGISITAHMHSLVCLGPDESALGNSLVLGDQRAIAEADVITAAVGLENIYRITGARMDASMPLAKIAWLRKNNPQIHRQARAFIAAKDWLRHQLTGDLLTDPIDACGSSLYDLQQMTWSPELIDIAGIRAEQLPVIADPVSTAGRLLPKAARQLGLNAGIPVIVGAGDDVEVLGNGMLEPGVSLEHLGTTGSILTCSDHLAYDPKLSIEVYPHVAPGRWVLGGSVTAAGLALSWVEQTLNGNGLGEFSARANQDPLIFLPHLSGERCPDWEPRSRGSWVGLSSTHTSADLHRAALEGIAFSLKNVLERIEALAGEQRSISIGLRELQNPAWTNLRAAIYDRPLAVLNTEEPTALGAMILAAVGIGVYPNLTGAVQAVTGSCQQINPVEKTAAAYHELYRFYLDASDSQRELMRRWQGRLTT